MLSRVISDVVSVSSPCRPCCPISRDFIQKKMFPFKQQECIPVGCVPPAAIAVTGVSPHRYPPPPEQAHPSSRHHPLGAGTPQSRHPQGRPPPTGCGPGDPPGLIPLNFPLGCGPGNLQGILGYRLQCMLGYHPLWTDTHL